MDELMEILSVVCFSTGVAITFLIIIGIVCATYLDKTWNKEEMQKNDTKHKENE